MQFVNMHLARFNAFGVLGRDELAFREQGGGGTPAAKLATIPLGVRLSLWTIPLGVRASASAAFAAQHGKREPKNEKEIVLR